MSPPLVRPPASRIPITGLAKGLIAFGGALAGLAMFMVLPWLFPAERDPHGGAYRLLGALFVAPVAVLGIGVGYLVHRLKHRSRVSR